MSMAVDLYANRQPLVIGVNIFLTIAAISAVGLRFLSRKLSRSFIWWDDWLIVAALVFVLGYNAASFYGNTPRKIMLKCQVTRAHILQLFTSASESTLRYCRQIPLFHTFEWPMSWRFSTFPP